MYSTSRCRHSQQNWDAGRSTASPNHFFIVARLAARRHHGRAPAASWFQVDAGERPFVIDPTLSQLQRCLGSALVSLAYSNLSFSSQKAAATHSNTSRFKIQKCKTGNGNRLPNREAVFSPNSMWYRPNWSCGFRWNFHGLHSSRIGRASHSHFLVSSYVSLTVDLG